MKSSALLRGGLAAFCLLGINPAVAATIRDKSGVVHAGRIPGYVVLKGRTAQPAGPGLDRAVATYLFVPGGNVAMIDQRGVWMGKEQLVIEATGGVAWIAFASYTAAAPADADVIRTATTATPGQRGFSPRFTRLGDGLFILLPVGPLDEKGPDSKAPSISERLMAMVGFFGKQESPYVEHAIGTARTLYQDFSKKAGVRSPEPWRWPGRLLGEIRPASKNEFHQAITLETATGAAGGSFNVSDIPQPPDAN